MKNNNKTSERKKIFFCYVYSLNVIRTEFSQILYWIPSNGIWMSNHKRNSIIFRFDILYELNLIKILCRNRRNQTIDINTSNERLFPLNKKL